VRVALNPSRQKPVWHPTSRKFPRDQAQKTSTAPTLLELSGCRLGNSPCSDNPVAMSRVLQKSPVFSRIAERVYRTGSLCLVLDKLDGVAGVVADERERNARVVVEFKDYFHAIGLQ